MEIIIQKWFNDEINRISRKFDLNYKIKIIFTEPMSYSLQGLLKELNVLIHYIKFQGDKNAPFRIRQYTNIMKILKDYPYSNLDDAEDVKQFLIKNGKKNPKSIMKRISEYIDKGYIHDAKDAMLNPNVRSMIELTKIYAIGPSKSKELYTKYGIITTEDLRKVFKTNKSIINKKQIIGLRYYEDLLKRIPRSELDKYNQELLKICKAISPELKMSINGSYRRGHVTSGDIDLLITAPNNKNKSLRKKLIKTLIEIGIIKEVLASGEKKFMGIVKLEKHGYTIARHLDIIDTSTENYPFAVLYFTGSGGFNSMMRGIALMKGYSMNEYCISDKKTKKPIDSSIIKSKIGKEQFETEKDIFKFLDMEYVEPEQRNTVTLNKL